MNKCKYFFIMLSLSFLFFQCKNYESMIGQYQKIAKYDHVILKIERDQTFTILHNNYEQFFCDSTDGKWTKKGNKIYLTSSFQGRENSYIKKIQNIEYQDSIKIKLVDANNTPMKIDFSLYIGDSLVWWKITDSNGVIILPTRGYDRAFSGLKINIKKLKGGFFYQYNHKKCEPLILTKELFYLKGDTLINEQYYFDIDGQKKKYIDKYLRR